MTSTVNSCKRTIKELEGEIRTLKAKLRDLSDLVQSVQEHPAFRLPPVSTFITKLRDSLDD